MKVSNKKERRNKKQHLTLKERKKIEDWLIVKISQKKNCWTTKKK